MIQNLIFVTEFSLIVDLITIKMLMSSSVMRGFRVHLQTGISRVIKYDFCGDGACEVYHNTTVNLNSDQMIYNNVFSQQRVAA